MEDAFRNQGFPFPPDPTIVVFLGREKLDHRTCTRLATFPRHQCADQRFAVNAIGLRPAMPARHGNRRGLYNVALDPGFLAQHSSQPEAIKSASWITTSGNSLASRRWAFWRRAAKHENRLAISPPVTVWRDIFSLPGDRAVTSHVDLLNSNETKIAPRSVGVAVCA
jgi:hypothetical protein